MISPALSTTLFSLLAFALFFSDHVILWRVSGAGVKGVKMIILLAVASYVAVAIIHYFLLNNFVVEHYAALPFFAFLMMAYLHLYVGVDRSVSIRVLGELYVAVDGRLSLDELRKNYSGDHMIRHRVELMVNEKWLEEANGFFRVSRKAALLARITIALKKLYGIDMGG